ncbi:hypothetical protein EV715DRAFT_194116 [Schizophyllum commune]
MAGLGLGVRVAAVLRFFLGGGEGGGEREEEGVGERRAVDVERRADRRVLAMVAIVASRDRRDRRVTTLTSLTLATPDRNCPRTRSPFAITRFTPDAHSNVSTHSARWPRAPTMSMRAALTAHASLLATQYTTHLPNILELQTVFLHDILPALADELDLDAPAQAAARAWLQDTITLFHIARRNQWTRSCAMDAVRKTLVWRLEHLPVEEACSHVADDQRSPSYTPPSHLLPHPDPAGRPVLVLKLRDLPPRAHRGAVIRALERLRAHLCRLNHERPEGPSTVPSSPLTAAPSSPLTAAPSAAKPLSSSLSSSSRKHSSHPSSSSIIGAHSTPALQYLLLLDLSSPPSTSSFPTMGIPNLDLDLITWTLRDASPKFPGLVAGVLVLNYSWAHAGLWGVAKRLIPEAGSGGRVWFPTTEELVDWFGEANLPEEYGGKLKWPPPSAPSPERAVSPAPSTISSVTSTHSTSRLSYPSSDRSAGSRAASPQPIPRAISLSPLSILNPFFGYPSHAHTSSDHPHQHAPASLHPRAAHTRHAHHRHTSHSLPHGRRRRRDLAKTLLLLFWARWGTFLTRVAWTAASLWALRKWTRILGVRIRTAEGRGILRTGKGWEIPRTGKGRGIPKRDWDALLALACTGFGAGAGV